MTERLDTSIISEKSAEEGIVASLLSEDDLNRPMERGFKTSQRLRKK